MAMGGDGPWAISVMWSLTAVTLIFVVLRVYTRVFVVKSYGVDDHVYNLAFVSFFFELMTRSDLAGLSILLHPLHDDFGEIWLWPEHERYQRPRRHGACDPIRGHWPNICCGGHGCCQVVSWTVSASACQGSMAQNCYLDIHGSLDGSVYICLLCLLVTVLTAQVFMGPSHSRPLPYRFNTSIDAPM